MEFKHSRIVHPAPYDASDLHGNIPLRQHSQPVKEDIGTIRCQADWSRHVRPLNNYLGGLAAHASVMQACVPECLPDRLEVISYANELAFLYDDATENISQHELQQQNDECQEVFRSYANGGQVSKQKSRGLKAVQAQVFAEMKAIDKPRAIEAMRAWTLFLEDAAGRRHHEHFNSLEEYNEYRLMDVGEMYWYGVVTFGMALTIPPEEQEICRNLAQPAYIGLGLQNDLYSWEKERRDAVSAGQSHVVNALYVLMQQNNCTENEAKLLCRQLIRDEVTTYEKVVEDNRHNESLSKDLRIYLEALLYSLSGNAWWSAICPRYNPDLSFSPLQQDMMNFGWEMGLCLNGISRDGSIWADKEVQSESWLEDDVDVFRNQSSFGEDRGFRPLAVASVSS